MLLSDRDSIILVVFGDPFCAVRPSPHPSEHDSAAAVEDDSEAAADHVVTPQILARKMELGQAVQKYTQLTLQFKAWQENFKLCVIRSMRP